MRTVNNDVVSVLTRTLTQTKPQDPKQPGRTFALFVVELASADRQCCSPSPRCTHRPRTRSLSRMESKGPISSSSLAVGFHRLPEALCPRSLPRTDSGKTPRRLRISIRRHLSIISMCFSISPPATPVPSRPHQAASQANRPAKSASRPRPAAAKMEDASNQVLRLGPDEVHALTRVLYLPASEWRGSRPSTAWLESQSRKVSQLPGSLLCREVSRTTGASRCGGSSVTGSGVSRSVVSKKGSQLDIATLCGAHALLDPQMIRHMFLLLQREVGVYLDIIGSYTGPLRIQAVADFEERMLGLSGLWTGSSTTCPDVSAYMLPYLESGCEACILSLIGGREQALIDLCASLISRRRGVKSAYKYPMLLGVVDAWIDCFGRDKAVVMDAQAAKLADEVRVVRYAVREVRGKRPGSMGGGSGHRRRAPRRFGGGRSESSVPDSARATVGSPRMSGSKGGLSAQAVIDPFQYMVSSEAPWAGPHPFDPIQYQVCLEASGANGPPATLHAAAYDCFSSEASQYGYGGADMSSLGESQMQEMREQLKDLTTSRSQPSQTSLKTSRVSSFRGQPLSASYFTATSTSSPMVHSNYRLRGQGPASLADISKLGKFDDGSSWVTYTVHSSENAGGNPSDMLTPFRESNARSGFTNQSPRSSKHTGTVTTTFVRPLSGPIIYTPSAYSNNDPGMSPVLARSAISAPRITKDPPALPQQKEHGVYVQPISMGPVDRSSFHGCSQSGIDYDAASVTPSRTTVLHSRESDIETSIAGGFGGKDRPVFRDPFADGDGTSSSRRATEPSVSPFTIPNSSNSASGIQYSHSTHRSHQSSSSHHRPAPTPSHPIIPPPPPPSSRRVDPSPSHLRHPAGALRASRTQSTRRNEGPPLSMDNPRFGQRHSLDTLAPSDSISRVAKRRYGGRRG
jgi:hypothetical protein